MKIETLSEGNKLHTDIEKAKTNIQTLEEGLNRISNMDANYAWTKGRKWSVSVILNGNIKAEGDMDVQLLIPLFENALNAQKVELAKLEKEFEELKDE